MMFLSYAQNFEDVLLWRALGHVKDGFYIDVGANDPVEHSVTKAFYDAGWHGINIEPLPSFHQAFLAQRRRDINLAVAAGAHAGSITLFDVPAVNGWASNDPQVAAAHREEGYEVAELDVPLVTLNDVCAEHVQGEIHFLKIDVEGFETEVLRGIDLQRWRPWVLVVEATLPNSRETNHGQWEAMVTGARYQFAYFDGLNRYYVAEEHAELMAALTVQPNVFDAFISYHLDHAWRANEQTQEQLVAAHARLHAASQQREDALAARQQAEAELQAVRANALARQQAADHSIAELNQHTANLVDEIASLRAHLSAAIANHAEAGRWAQALQSELQAQQASRSWRWTRALRMAESIARGHAGAAFKARMGALLLRMASSEQVRRLVIPLLLRMPLLDTLAAKVLRRVRRPETSAGPAGGDDLAPDLRELPLSARRVLADLQRQVKKDA